MRAGDSKPLFKTSASEPLDGFNQINYVYWDYFSFFYNVLSCPRLWKTTLASSPDDKARLPQRYRDEEVLLQGQVGELGTLLQGSSFKRADSVVVQKQVFQISEVPEILRRNLPNEIIADIQLLQPGWQSEGQRLKLVLGHLESG